jgi:hypothetical protein
LTPNNKERVKEIHEVPVIKKQKIDHSSSEDEEKTPD